MGCSYKVSGVCMKTCHTTHGHWCKKVLEREWEPRGRKSVNEHLIHCDEAKVASRGVPTSLPVAKEGSSVLLSFCTPIPTLGPGGDRQVRVEELQAHG